MGKIAKVQEVPLTKLRPYERNAKIHGQSQVEKIKASIQEFGFLSPCLIDSDYNIIAGHGRVAAAKELGLTKVPCVFIEGLTEEQRRAYILADNKLTELGEWDMEIANQELFDLKLGDFDVEITGFEMPGDWFEDRERFDRSRQEGNDEYNEFLDKFEEPKTTDDCYTPDNIYDVIASRVEKKYKVNRKNFVRPFYPGGDYQAEKYAKGSIVVDNPPFSILAEIVDFYVEKKQPFFLFCPGVSTLGYTTREGVAAVCTFCTITYENGAKVSTSFLTNLEPPDVVALSDPELFELVDKKNSENEAGMHKSMPKYDYPLNCITSAKLGYLSKYGQNFIIKRNESFFVRALDAQREEDRAIFGGGLLLSERAAAERAAALRFPLSDREKEIIMGLGGSE